MKGRTAKHLWTENREQNRNDRTEFGRKDPLDDATKGNKWDILTPFISHICYFCDFKCFLKFWYDSSHDSHKGRTWHNQERIVAHAMQHSTTGDKDNYDIT